MKKKITRRQFAVGSSAAVGIIASGAGIAQSQSTPQSDSKYAPLNVPSGHKQFSYENIISNDAVSINIPVGIINGVTEGPTLAITGGIFGTEYCGIEAASRLYRDIDPKNLKGRLIILPVVNMPAFQFRNPSFVLANGNNPIDGKSVNSSFPGKKNGTASEIIAHYVFNDLVSKADYLIDLRGGDVEENHLVHTMFSNQSSERVNRISREMALATGFKYYQSRGLRPGGLYGTAIASDIPAMITQSGAGYKIQPDEENINHHIKAVTNVMKHFGMLAGKPEIAEEQFELSSKYTVVRATKSGVFQASEEPGLELKKGQVIGRVTSLDGSVLEEVTAPNNGVLHTVFVRRVVTSGDVLSYILEVVG